ncbi:transcription initiation factor IIA, gamma subunit, helical domain-containing protein [Gorgonomyces haynaldii]|nr:transcription initiation factor IIA, gamma subunit, helical domain-containing protein [Gorgonomyces haynaldii]
MTTPFAYEHYRSSTIGVALTEAVDDLVQEGQLDPQLAMKVMQQFDISVGEALKNKVRARATLRGHLHMYRSCDDVYTFVVSDANFRFENETVKADKVKIVACSARTQ